MATSFDGKGGGRGPTGKEPELPLIEYPTDYAFKIIGKATPDFSDWARGLVAAALQQDIPDSDVSQNVSRQGTYVSVEVRVHLTSEEQRRAVYARLHGESRIVLYL